MKPHFGISACVIALACGRVDHPRLITKFKPKNARAIARPGGDPILAAGATSDELSLLAKFILTTTYLQCDSLHCHAPGLAISLPRDGHYFAYVAIGTANASCMRCTRISVRLPRHRLVAIDPAHLTVLHPHEPFNLRAPLGRQSQQQRVIRQAQQHLN